MRYFRAKVYFKSFRPKYCIVPVSSPWVFEDEETPMRPFKWKPSSKTCMCYWLCCTAWLNPECGHSGSLQPGGQWTLAILCHIFTQSIKLHHVRSCSSYIQTWPVVKKAACKKAPTRSKLEQLQRKIHVLHSFPLNAWIVMWRWIGVLGDWTPV